jgi:D-sedoheptulose 7-phosphate isomerase
MTATVNYINRVKNLLNNIDSNQIKSMAEELTQVRKTDSTLFTAGNGGSASTASHFVTDIGQGSLKFKKNIKSICLNDNIPVMTATGNDESFENIFLNQVIMLARNLDALFLISASGNSKNLLSAAHFARTKNIKVLSLTGFDGGELKGISDVNIHVKSDFGEYGPVEDAHSAICHNLTEILRSN